jgi:hypothetical protein
MITALLLIFSTQNFEKVMSLCHLLHISGKRDDRLFLGKNCPCLKVVVKKYDMVMV